MSAKPTKNRARQRKREVEREIARISKLAEQALAALDEPVTAELPRLKAEMAAAHPDRGGTSEAFIKARELYLAAKRIAAPRLIVLIGRETDQVECWGSSTTRNA